jgi:hypothetical protein
VLIRSRYDSHHYDVQFFYRGDPRQVGTPFNLKLCPDTIVDWDNNSLAKNITFEDRGWCKSLASSHTGYAFYRDSNGKLITKENYEPREEAR